MTSSRVQRVPFHPDHVLPWAALDTRRTNWPVVYTINDHAEVYVGESRNVSSRLLQHLKNDQKQHLSSASIIVDDTFNKSVCLDLESYLIRLLAGDGTYRVLNRNDGVTNADYFDRGDYQSHFREIFEDLRAEGLFSRSVSEIENSDLFKLSPFKALTQDQAAAVEDILEGLFEDLARGTDSTIVIQGDPGTGKTVVALFLMKLLSDIAAPPLPEALDSDALFTDFFAPGYRELLSNFTIGIVVPQQSLRKSIQGVFAKTPGLESARALSPFDLMKTPGTFDLLIVDEAHRLTQRANQPSASLNTKFSEFNHQLFGEDSLSRTQLDWVKAKSRHQLFLLDQQQSVKPADLPKTTLEDLCLVADAAHRRYRLATQMRVGAGNTYIPFVRQLLQGLPQQYPDAGFGEYEFTLFNDVGKMQDQIVAQDSEFGLSRMAAGFAWPWRTRGNKPGHDFVLDGRELRWNSTATDWINSPNSLQEVGSIHTLQGYDLNYAGVIIGPDLRFDPATRQMFFSRQDYHDKKGKENNPKLGRNYSDADLLAFVQNIYGVLLTRGIRGTYLYICDPHLRAYVRQLLPETAWRE